MPDTIVQLSKPISAHGEEVTSLTLREPTGKDVKECGVPFGIEGGGVVLQPAPAAKLISRLAGIPSSSVDALSAPDFLTLANTVIGFFSSSREAQTP